MPRSVMMPAMSSCGVTSNAGFRMSAPPGASWRAADVRHLARVALLDRNLPAVRRAEVDRRERRRDVERDAVLAREHRHACRCRSCSPCRRWPRCDPRRRRRGRPAPARISAPAMLSVITVVWMPSRTSSHAVSRAPCRNGRVSSANTVTCLPCFDGAADDAERRAVARRRQRARVAVREDARVGRARPPRRTRPSRGSSRRPRRESRSASRSRRSLICSTDSPASAAAANARFIRSIAQNRLTAVGRVAAISSQVLWNSAANFCVPVARAPAHAERDAHRRRHADGRRAADDHRLDGARHLGRRLAADVDFLGRAACADRSSRRRRLRGQSSEASD